MARYYDTNEQTYTYIPRNVLSRHTEQDFIDVCEKTHGVQVAIQAKDILARHACESQNANALENIRKVAVQTGEMNLAMAVGDYLDRLNY